MKGYRVSVVIEKDADGYFAFCPELQGCYTQGDDYEETLKNIKDAIYLHIEGDSMEAERYDGRNEGMAIRAAARKLITERKLSKYGQNVIKDVEWGLSG